jgi:hypothetical protein
VLFSPHEEFVRYTLEAVQNFRRILKLLELQASDFLVSRVVICQCLSDIGSGSFSLYDQNFNLRNNKNDNEVKSIFFSFLFPPDCKSLNLFIGRLKNEMRFCVMCKVIRHLIFRSNIESLKMVFVIYQQWDMSIISKSVLTTQAGYLSFW